MKKYEHCALRRLLDELKLRVYREGRYPKWYSNKDERKALLAGYDARGTPPFRSARYVWAVRQVNALSRVLEHADVPDYEWRLMR